MVDGGADHPATHLFGEKDQVLMEEAELRKGGTSNCTSQPCGNGELVTVCSPWVGLNSPNIQP